MKDNTKISIQKDGNKWCVLWGENLQEGIAGFGDTIEDAMEEFAHNAFEKIGLSKLYMFAKNIKIDKPRVLAQGRICKEIYQGGLMGYRVFIGDKGWDETIKYSASKLDGRSGKLIFIETKESNND
jgi:hypothetical protein